MSLSHLKFRHLMLVEFLVRHGTLHKAARLLNISQPAATGMLNDLEQLLGISLFTRSRLGVAPTPSAQALLAKVRTLLNEFNDFTTAVGRAAEGRDVVLRVGVVPQAFVAYMPQTIEIFRARGGGALRAQEGTARQLLDLLLDGQLDCVIGRLPSDGLPEGRRASDLSMEPVYRDEVCLVAEAEGGVARAELAGALEEAHHFAIARIGGHAVPGAWREPRLGGRHELVHPRGEGAVVVVELRCDLVGFRRVIQRQQPAAESCIADATTGIDSGAEQKAEMVGRHRPADPGHPQQSRHTGIVLMTSGDQALGHIGAVQAL